MLLDPSHVKQWQDEIKTYQESRKKLPWEQNSRPNVVTNKQVKQKEVEYNPILQVYKEQNQEQESRYKEEVQVKNIQEKKRQKLSKYEQNYNIVNMEGTLNGGLKLDGVEKIKQRLMPSKQVDYNIINNQKYDDSHFVNVKKVAEQKEKTKKAVHEPPREFNILSNKYVNNHEDKFQEDFDHTKKELDQKYWQTHDYNPITAKYYDDLKEQDFEKKIQEEMHIQKAKNRLPPSWKYRESLILDRTKEFPPEIQEIDLKQKLAKKRYEVRYNLENEYRQRDIEDQDIKQERALNRQYDQKYIDEMQKGFDLLTLEPVSQSKAQSLLRRQKESTWDQIQKNSHYNQTFYQDNYVSENYNSGNLDANTPNMYENLTENSIKYINNGREVGLNENDQREEVQTAHENIRHCNNTLDQRINQTATNFPKIGQSSIRTGELAKRGYDVLTKTNSQKPQLQLDDNKTVLQHLNHDKKLPLFGPKTNELLKHKQISNIDNQANSTTSKLINVSIKHIPNPTPIDFTGSTKRIKTGGFY